VRYLLDTHVLLWWSMRSPRMSDGASKLIADGRNELLWSVASTWELAIKAAIGRIRLPAPARVFVPEALREYLVSPLAIQQDHALRAAELPPLHKDPFDRMLVAQAEIEGLAIISADRVLAKYAVRIIW